ncbi:MAG: S-layer homology domain-containing protein [Lachnospiraceae bacterium]|nr:S-layer homology domain-containing protein [Lachnospiraceae bacterium]
MLNKYGEVQGYDVSKKASLDQFTDLSQVPGWAVEFISWAVDAQMITGKPNEDATFRLAPQDGATRAECAKMLMMFMEKYTSVS